MFICYAQMHKDKIKLPLKEKLIASYILASQDIKPTTIPHQTTNQEILKTTLMSKTMRNGNHSIMSKMNQVIVHNSNKSIAHHTTKAWFNSINSHWTTLHTIFL